MTTTPQRIDIAAVPAGSRDAWALGALLGLAVGDALGTTYEFRAIGQPAYPALATEPATDITGGGPFELPAGACTDDTQMAVCLARSLAERGAFDADDVARRYVAWMEHAFDVGNQTSASLERIARGDRDGGITTWRAGGRRAAGNGSLMRTAPIGVAFAESIASPGFAGARSTPARGAELLIDIALRESLITHADPRCALACAIFDAAIAHPASPLAAARDALPTAAHRLRELLDEPAAIATAVADLTTDLDAAASSDPDVYGALHIHRTQGFVRVALRLAFWHAHHTPSWRDAVVDVASRGGDADTNAAIVGALLGARDGVTAIPGAWIDRVLAAPAPTPWHEAHHPRHLLMLVRA